MAMTKFTQKELQYAVNRIKDVTNIALQNFNAVPDYDFSEVSKNMMSSLVIAEHDNLLKMFDLMIQLGLIEIDPTANNLGHLIDFDINFLEPDSGNPAHAHARLLYDGLRDKIRIMCLTNQEMADKNIVKKDEIRSKINNASAEAIDRVMLGAVTMDEMKGLLQNIESLV